MYIPDTLIVAEFSVFVVIVFVVVILALRLLRDGLAAEGRHLARQFARNLGNGGEAEGEEAPRVVLGRGVQEVWRRGKGRGGRGTLVKLLRILGDLGHDC